MKPKTCFVRNAGDGLIDFTAEPRGHAGEYMKPEGFRALFGWCPGKRPVEVLLRRKHRKKSGQFKPDRKSKPAKRRAKLRR